MRYTVTGPTKVTPEERSRIRRYLMKLLRPGIDEVISGCAEGVDTIAAEIAYEQGCKVTLVVPSAPHNVDLVARFIGKPGVTVHYARSAQAPAAAYMIRNDEAVARGDKLIAFPRKLTFYRSGEWATINRAKNAAKPVVMADPLLPKEKVT